MREKLLNKYGKNEKNISQNDCMDRKFSKRA